MRNRFLIALLSIFSITACSDSVTPVELPYPDRIELLPVANSFPQLERGETLQISATLFDNRNNPIPDAEILWESSNSNVAHVDRNGVVIARNVGIAQIAAISGAIRSVLYVNVVRESVATVRLDLTVPGTGLIVGNSIAATATALSARGDTITRYGVTWTSSDTTVASVSTTGAITGVSDGTATITARIDDKSATASVRVVARNPTQLIVSPMALALERGETRAITATVLDQFGGSLNNVVTWQSSNPAIATVNASGTVTAVAVGTATIVATSGALRAETFVSVNRETVDRVVLNVQLPSSFVVGSTVTATATALSARGDTITRYNTAWVSSTTSVATVSSLGVITAVAPGTSTVTATIDGKSASTVVTVVAPPAPPARVPTSVRVTPSATQIEVSATTTITGQVLDQFGAVLESATSSWASTNPLVASVSNTGVITGLQVGNTEIVFTSGTLSARATVFVIAETVSSVVVTTNAPATGLVVGNTATTTVTARSARNNVITGLSATWASSNTNVATVSPLGVITAVSEGTVTISATVAGVTGNVQVTTRLVPAATVTLTTATSTTFVGRTNQATATLLSASGAPLTTAQRTLTWATSNPTIASVSNTGLITGVASGTARISVIVTSPNATPTVGFIDIVVEQVAINSVQVVMVSSATTTLTLGSVTEFRARALDINNVELSEVELNNRVFTWSVTSTTSTMPIAETPQTSLVHTLRRYTALVVGVAKVVATISGTSGEIEVTVVPTP